MELLHSGQFELLAIAMVCLRDPTALQPQRVSMPRRLPNAMRFRDHMRSGKIGKMVAAMPPFVFFFLYISVRLL